MSRTGRRATLGLGSTTKLNRRLELRKIFDQLDMDSSGGVSVTELNNGIENNPELKQFFDSVSAETNQSLFSAMDADNDGAITWDEFMEFVNHSEKRDELGLPASYKFAANKYRPGKLMRMSGSQDLAVATQKMAAQLLVDGDQVQLRVMPFDDPRVGVARPDTLVTVDSGTIESEIAARADDLVRNNSVDASFTPLLADEIRGAAIRACQAELKMIQRIDKRMAARLGELAITVLQSEEALLRAGAEARRVAALTDTETTTLSLTHSKLDETGQADELVGQLEREGCTSTARLARRLAELQAQLAKTTEDLGGQAPWQKGSSTGEEEFVKVDTDGDGMLSRQEWALWYNKKMEIMREANEQRRRLITDNARLRKALSQRAEGAFKDKIGQRDRLNDDLHKTRLQNDNLRHEIALIDTEAAELSAEVTLMEDERANSLRVTTGGSTDPEAADLPAQERLLILKNWADEKEGVLTIHERARQEWELERASLLAHRNPPKPQQQDRRSVAEE